MDFGLILLLLIAGAGAYVWSSRQRYEQKRLAESSHHEDKQRIAECGEVVRFFAHTLGYMARDAAAKDELEALIDNGMEAGDLTHFIAGRIEQIEALELGDHRVSGLNVPVKLLQRYRDRHVYVIGKSGAGKTTLLRSMIMQDMEAGEGLAVIAPEQEMIENEILPFVPEHRVQDVVYFNPGDLAHPVSFNPLYLEAGESIDHRVDDNVTIFKRLLGNDATPRTDELMRQAFYALLEVPGTTLLDLPRLLDVENAHYRNHVITSLGDSYTAQFWREIYPSFPKNAHLPLVYRMSRFTRSKHMRAILCQPESTINFRQVMDSGKILLCNFSDGVLGEQNSQLLGSLVISKLQLSVMGRASVPPEKRRRFYLYVDEFQAFTGLSSSSYEKILSRARKYKLSLTLAHQQTNQIPSSLLKEILGNVSTVVSFAVARDDARRIAGEFVSASAVDVETLDPNALLSLKVGETFCRIGTTAFAMRTRPITARPNFARRKQVVNTSRETYGQASRAESRHTPESPPEADSGFDDVNPGEVFG